MFKSKIYTCEDCSKKFTIEKFRFGVKYCSRLCSNRGVSKSTAVHRGNVLRGKGNKAYIKLNSRHLHRVQAEKKIGRKLKKGEIVHHKNGNKLDNRLSNLEVMTQSQHATLHFTKYGPKCKQKSCLFQNRKGYAYCSKHQSQVDRHGKTQ